MLAYFDLFKYEFNPVIVLEATAIWIVITVALVASSLRKAYKNKNRSGLANLNNFISGNSGSKAEPMMARTGVFDGQEISAPYPAHSHQRVQSARRACRIAGGQDDGAVMRAV
jgi:hypothetical protein